MIVPPPLELPDPPEIHEEPIRPLLAVLDHAARATLLALDAENPDGWPNPDVDGVMPLDVAAWVELALAIQIEGLLKLLELHAQALRERHRRRTSPDLDF